jgi:pyruvate/2-oxoglutarate dehydrogenase complex dihydrolipoamide acyltransferase (E2) component
MRINELLVESQQLDEGPFTQAMGKVGGKIAKGVANVGKDLKTGFKAGYSGEQPASAPRDPDVPMNPKTGKPLTEPERQAHQDAGGKFDGVTGDPLPLDTKAAPAKSGGLKGALNSFKQGFTKGYKGATTPAADTAAPTSTNTTAAPANTTATDASTAAPAADPAAEKQSKIGVGQINKIIPH